MVVTCRFDAGAVANYKFGYWLLDVEKGDEREEDRNGWIAMNSEEKRSTIEDEGSMIV